MKQIIFVPEIASELDQSLEYYKKQEIGLEKLFLDEIEKALKKIQKNPERYHLIEDNIRKYIIKQYPYKIIYTIKPETIIIIAIVHQKRKPDYWKGRI